MSNPMMQAGPQRDVLKETQSPLNGPDAAMMKKSGQVNPEGTFGEFMESSFGIQWEDPMQTAMGKLKGAAQNATPMGKVKSMAGNAGMQPGGMPRPGMPEKPMPQGRPPAVGGGLESLMGGM